MRKDVGKRIMEIACAIENIISGLTMVVGVISIFAGLVPLFSLDSDPGFELLIAALLIGNGILWIWLGKWISEVITIMIYGFGVIVDKMEHLRQEVICEQPAQNNNSKPGTSAQSIPATKSKILSPKTDNNLRAGWWCECGYWNPQSWSTCQSCYKRRK